MEKPPVLSDEELNIIDWESEWQEFIQQIRQQTAREIFGFFTAYKVVETANLSPLGTSVMFVVPLNRLEEAKAKYIK